MPEPQVYSVTEAEILKISRLMGALEDAVKEVIRLSKGNPEPAPFFEIEFYRQIGTQDDQSSNIF